jgi:hypothetical protein
MKMCLNSVQLTCNGTVKPQSIIPICTIFRYPSFCFCGPWTDLFHIFSLYMCPHLLFSHANHFFSGHTMKMMNWGFTAVGYCMMSCQLLRLCRTQLGRVWWLRMVNREERKSMKDQGWFCFISQKCLNHLLLVGRIRRVLMMVYNTKNYWVTWLWPSSGILNTRKHSISETGTISILR